jgi:hypothetical protein
MIRASLSRDGGEAWNLALLLLCPTKSSLLREEFSALVDLIKESETSALMNAFDSFEIPSANTVTAALSTRHASVVGIGEASEIWSLAARYQDSGIIMPPSVAKWNKAWYVEMVPGFAESWADDVQDVFNKLVLKQSPEYTTADPPSLLGGPQSSGYKNTLYDILRANIEAYTKPSKSEKAPGAGVPGTE